MTARSNPFNVSPSCTDPLCDGPWSVCRDDRSHGVSPLRLRFTVNASPHTSRKPSSPAAAQHLTRRRSRDCAFAGFNFPILH